MNTKQLAQILADTFANGMFSGHAPLYRDGLEAFLLTVIQTTREDTLSEALATVIRMSPDTGPEPTLMETELRAMIERERTHE